MSNVQVQISQLPTASTLTGAELVPIVQNGITAQTTVGNIASSPTLTQTFLTVTNQSSTLANSRYIGAGSGLIGTDGGSGSTYTLSLTGAPLALLGTGTGIQVKTDTSTMSAVQIATSGNGLSIANPDGTTGNPTLSLSGVVANLANLSGGTGFVTINGTNLSQVTLQGTSGQITVTNGNGSSSPVFSLASTSITSGTYTLPTVTFDAYGRATSATNATTTGTGSVVLQASPALTGSPTATTPLTSDNSTRIATTAFVNNFIGSFGVLSFSGGATGLTPSTATVGAVVLGGILNVANGGTGLSTTPTNGQILIGNGLGYTLTTLTAGTGLTITNGSGSITPSISNTGVSAGTYGSASVIPQITVNAQGQITSVTNQSTNAPSYQGTWNASTNTPTLTSSVGTQGYYYVVSVAGTTSLNGVANWSVGDWAIFSGSVWEKIPGSNSESFTSLTTTNLAVTGLTGYMYANGSSNVTASTSIPTSALTGVLGYANGGTGQSAVTTGDLLYGSATNTWSRLGIGSNGTILRVVSGVPAWGTDYVGTVTSVAQSFTGGLISVSGSPITTSGTLALTVAGTSGGIPYFSGASTWASSAVLTANALMIGGGAGTAPSTTTTGTGVLTALGVNTGSVGAFVVNGGALGTPSSGTLTNATGLPVSTGISGLGTGVATALAVNTGTAGSFVVNGGALGTPSSGTVTNLTGTASININGTVGATTPTTGAFTTVSASGQITSTVSTGTAPFVVSSTTQVANLNVATAGSATNATNATNTGITATSTGATNYLTFVTATSGNLPQLVNSSITANAVNGTITGGIAGGAF
jgi:hypothetical protein